MADETWKVVLAKGAVREVEVIEADGGWQASVDGRVGGFSRKSARRAVIRFAMHAEWPLAAVVAPGESTRAEALAEGVERDFADWMQSEIARLETEVTRLRGVCEIDRKTVENKTREQARQIARFDTAKGETLAIRRALRCIPDDATSLDAVRLAGIVGNAAEVVDRIAVALGMGYPERPEQIVGYAEEVMAALREAQGPRPSALHAAVQALRARAEASLRNDGVDDVEGSAICLVYDLANNNWLGFLGDTDATNVHTEGEACATPEEALASLDAALEQEEPDDAR